jgi:hypothetical protein
VKANIKVNPITVTYLQHQKLIAVREMLIANNFLTVNGEDKIYEVSSSNRANTTNSTTINNNNNNNNAQNMKTAESHLHSADVSILFNSFILVFFRFEEIEHINE